MIRENDFVMWPDCNCPPWDREVSLYAAHFLVEAEKSGQKLGPESKKQVMKFLSKWAVSTNAAVSAYACHTLALAGKPDKDRMFRLYDMRKKLDFLSRARLARAFAAAHDRQRAEALLENAGDPESVKEAAFAALALLDFKPDDARIERLVDYLLRNRDPAKFSWGTTDTNAHALLAIGEYYRHHPVKAGAPKVAFAPAGGKAVTLGDRGAAKFDSAAVIAENGGDATAYISWKALELVPARSAKDEPGSGALKVERKFFKSNGEPADMEDLRCGDLVVVDIAVSSAEKRTLSDLVVEDLFAAAFEPVHGDLDPAVWGASGASWVMRKDARDDRMLVFSKKFTLEAGNEVHFRYPVRVVSAGEFVLPGTALEGMYDPRLKCRRAAGRIVVRH